MDDIIKWFRERKLIFMVLLVAIIWIGASIRDITYGCYIGILVVFYFVYVIEKKDIEISEQKKEIEDLKKELEQSHETIMRLLENGK